MDGGELERLYMEYIEIEKCIKRLREIKEQYSYRSLHTRLKARARAGMIENDVERSRRFQERIAGCRRYDVDDPFWTEMSRMFGMSRNACYSRWINSRDRKLSKKEAEEIRPGNWIETAREMECPPFRVFCEYVRRASADARPKLWTKDEDRLLEQGVAEHGTSRWRFVSRVVGSRTGKECAMRFYFLNKNVRKGKWSEDEERRLAEGVQMHGEGEWRSISNHVMTRNPMQCRSKFLDDRGARPSST